MPDKYMLQFSHPEVNDIDKEVVLFDLKTNGVNIGIVKRISAATVRYIINGDIVMDVHSNNNSIHKDLDGSFGYVENTILTKAGNLIGKHVTVYEAIYDVSDSKVVMIEWLD